MSRMTFINLPVRDLEATTAFFTTLGLEFNQEFSDHQTGCLILGDETWAMLMTEERFTEFTGKGISDASSSEVIIGLSATSREEVDELTRKALDGGAEDLGGSDQDGMYMHGFRDLDGHQWSFIHMSFG